MNNWLIAAALTLGTIQVGAQPTPSRGAAAPAVPVTQPTPPTATPTPASAQTPAGPAVVTPGSQPDPTAQAARALANVEASLSRIEHRMPAVWWTTPLTTFISVVIGGLLSGCIAYAMQVRLQKHQGDQASKRATLDEALADKKARHEVEQAKFEWHLRQLMELYGPLRALFDGSNEVYRRMNEVLISHDPRRYRDLTLSDQGEQPKSIDPDHRYFETFDESIGEWRKFRTIIDWTSVYGRGLGVDGYFDRIVSIGDRISKLIEVKSGLVMPHHGDLLAAFGKYLAHFEVLRELHAQSQPNTDDTSRTAIGAPMTVRVAAAFPNKIQELVTAGSDELLAELARRSAAKASGTA